MAQKNSGCATYGASLWRGLLCSEYPLDSQGKTDNQLKSPFRLPIKGSITEEEKNNNKGASSRWRDLYFAPPPPPLSSLQQLDLTATSSPKSCLPVCLFFFFFLFLAQQSGPAAEVWQVRSMTERLVSWIGGPGVCVWDLIGKFSQQKGRDEGPACVRGPPLGISSQEEEEGEEKKNPTGLDSRVRKREKKQNKRRWRHATHTRASGFFSSTSSSSFFFYSFSFSFSFFFSCCCCCCCCCAGCVRLDLWAGNEASLWVCGF